MMASCVFRVRLVEMGKPSPPDAFTKRSSHCLRSVVVLHIACKVPHLVSLVLVHFIRGILACLKKFSRSSRHELSSSSWCRRTLPAARLLLRINISTSSTARA